MTIEIEPIGVVVEGRQEVADDNWGGTTSIIQLDPKFPLDVVRGLDSFSHLIVTWHFNRASPDDVALHARSPRNDPRWEPSGTFAHRNHRRPNQLATSFPRLLKVEAWPYTSPTSMPSSEPPYTISRPTSKPWGHVGKYVSLPGLARCSRATGTDRSWIPTTPRRRALGRGATERESGVAITWEQCWGGEHSAPPAGLSLKWRPSPHARGAGDRYHAAWDGAGTIPACTGSRTPPRRGLCAPWDLPRVHGEQSSRPGTSLREDAEDSQFHRFAPIGHIGRSRRVAQSDMPHRQTTRRHYQRLGHLTAPEDIDPDIIVATQSSLYIAVLRSAPGPGGTIPVRAGSQLESAAMRIIRRLPTSRSVFHNCCTITQKTPGNRS